MQEQTLRPISAIPLSTALTARGTILAPSPLTPDVPRSHPTPPEQNPSEPCRACRGMGRVYVATDDPRITESRPCPKCGIEHIARSMQAVYPLPAEWENYDLADFQPTAGE